MLAEQQTLDGMPETAANDIPSQKASRTHTPPAPTPTEPPVLDDETYPPVDASITMHIKGNPANYDRDILRVIQVSLNAITTLATSRPAGNVTPLFTAGHNHYTRLALLPCLIDMARPYVNEDERKLLIWAQKTIHHEALLRSQGKPLPHMNQKALVRLRALSRRVQTSLDTLAVNSGMRRTAATRRSIAETFGEDALNHVSGPVALV